jgi:sugar-specific transcriptional regulator TrmB
MIVKNDFLSKLKVFGLNTYESKLWTALLSRGVSTAGELSDIANVPRSRSYDVLESLEKKGFIIMKIGKPIKYMAVPPEEVLERVKKSVQVDAEEQLKRMNDVKKSEILDELNLLHKQGVEFVEPSDLSGALRGRNNIYNYMESMVRGAEKSVTIMTTADGLERKKEALKPVLQKAKDKGIKIRIAAPLKDSSIAKDWKAIADIRHVDDVNARFVVVDGKDVMFMVMDDKDVHPTYDVGIWVNTPFFASALEKMFDSVWKNK